MKDLLSIASREKTVTKVTIGVCTRNNEATIAAAIESIRKQKYPMKLMQVIFVDGCSTDKTLVIVRNTTSEMSMPVEIFSDEGEGLGAARQIVVDNANGDYLIFVDGDVEIPDDFVQKQIDYMEKNPNVAIAIARYLVSARESNFISTVWNLKQHSTIKLGCDATICRVKALRQVGGFDQNMRGASEDKDLIFRVKKKGWAFSLNEETGFYHASRNSVREFWAEQVWFGFGNHYLYHKDSNLGPLWRCLPVGSFRYGIKLAKKSYELTNRKLSFFIPFLMGFANIAWWVGFTKAHFNGYGHKKVG